jgi:hypothetical protein
VAVEDIIATSLDVPLSSQEDKLATREGNSLKSPRGVFTSRLGVR